MRDPGLGVLARQDLRAELSDAVGTVRLRQMIERPFFPGDTAG
jgi:hypothetical protein